MTARMLCLTLLGALGCSARAEQTPLRSPAARTPTFTAAVAAPPLPRGDLFTSNGSGVRRIDAALP